MWVKTSEGNVLNLSIARNIPPILQDGNLYASFPDSDAAAVNGQRQYLLFNQTAMTTGHAARNYLLNELKCGRSNYIDFQDVNIFP